MPTSHSFTSQRLKLRYLDWGNPDAPPLLLIHGGKDHARSWDWNAEALREDWHVIAPDLRGHGDSAWEPTGDYLMHGYVYDLAQLVEQLGLAPVAIVAHSLGGNVAVRYAGLYPDKVSKLVSIEGLGPSPKVVAERRETPFVERWREWMDRKRAAAARTPRRYASFEDALERMRAANKSLSDEQLRHLTLHGSDRNEDGSWSWKFDPYLGNWPPFDLPRREIEALWAAITCPTLLMYGGKSWASNPAEDGRAARFRNARVSLFEDAGHWLHHDEFERFLSEVRGFLGRP